MLLLQPLLAELGRRWQDGEGPVAEEHFFACYLRNKVKAQWAADRVADTYRPLLKKVCLNNGVQLK